MQRANSVSSRDIAFTLHPYTNLKKHETEGPLVVTEGRGIYVYDENGKEYIEGLAGLWCTALGFSEERLVDAATRQLKRLPFYHLFNHKTHDVGAELAERLIALMPVEMSKVFFNNSGSEANDTAVKLVWYYNNAIGRPRKKKVIARMKGYHGSTIASASLAGLPFMHMDFDLPIAGIRHTDCPAYYRGAKPGESEEDFASRMAENLDSLIEREGPDTVAAFIAEPVQGSGGVVVPPRTYFEKIQAVLQKHDVLFIADEVICGFGRTGRMFGCETFGIAPDIMTVAKSLSSAYLPISATIINEKVYQGLASNSEKLASFTHGFTYSGHPVCAAVALETLKIYEERDVLGHVQRVAPGFQAGLRRFMDHPLVGDVRGVGLMGGVELVRDKATKQPFDAKAGVGTFFEECAHEQGLLMRGRGEQLVLSPPLIITDVEVDDLLARLGRALDATADFVQRMEV
jgi:4-aminobutyrate---pyruvate transaminase